jgi:hypothetical protein
MADIRPPWVIRGVVFSEEGEPASGVVVSLTSAPVPVPDIAALTGEAGDFMLSAPVTGEYVVTISYPDGRQERRTVEVTEESAGVTLEVRPGH